MADESLSHAYQGVPTHLSRETLEAWQARPTGQILVLLTENRKDADVERVLAEWPDGVTPERVHEEAMKHRAALPDRWFRVDHNYPWWCEPGTYPIRGYVFLTEADRLAFVEQCRAEDAEAERLRVEAVEAKKAAQKARRKAPKRASGGQGNEDAIMGLPALGGIFDPAWSEPTQCVPSSPVSGTPSGGVLPPGGQDEDDDYDPAKYGL